MPRKVDPRWGKDGYEDNPPPFSLTGEEVTDLARILEVDPASPKADELRSAVIYIGGTYRRWKDRGADAFDRAQARRALEELLAAGRIDYAALTALNERALQCVHDSLLMMSPAPVGPNGSVTVALTEDRIDETTLRQAAQDAVTRLKAKKGPDRDGELAWAVAELCRLYEELTGRRATHSSKDPDLRYTQEPQSEAGRFVRACFRLIDGRIAHTRINRAMRFFIEGRDQGRN